MICSAEAVAVQPRLILFVGPLPVLMVYLPH